MQEFASAAKPPKGDWGRSNQIEDPGVVPHPMLALTLRPLSLVSQNLHKRNSK